MPLPGVLPLTGILLDFAPSLTFITVPGSSPGFNPVSNPTPVPDEGTAPLTPNVQAAQAAADAAAAAGRLPPATGTAPITPLVQAAQAAADAAAAAAPPVAPGVPATPGTVSSWGGPAGIPPPGGTPTVPGSIIVNGQIMTPTEFAIFRADFVANLNRRLAIIQNMTGIAQSNAIAATNKIISLAVATTQGTPSTNPIYSAIPDNVKTFFRIGNLTSTIVNGQGGFGISNGTPAYLPPEFVYTINMTTKQHITMLGGNITDTLLYSIENPRPGSALIPLELAPGTRIPSIGGIYDPQGLLRLPGSQQCWVTPRNNSSTGVISQFFSILFNGQYSNYIQLNDGSLVLVSVTNTPPVRTAGVPHIVVVPPPAAGPPPATVATNTTTQTVPGVPTTTVGRIVQGSLGIAGIIGTAFSVQKIWDGLTLQFGDANVRNQTVAGFYNLPVSIWTKLQNSSFSALTPVLFLKEVYDALQTWQQGTPIPANVQALLDIGFTPAEWRFWLDYIRSNSRNLTFSGITNTASNSAVQIMINLSTQQAAPQNQADLNTVLGILLNPNPATQIQSLIALPDRVKNLILSIPSLFNRLVANFSQTPDLQTILLLWLNPSPSAVVPQIQGPTLPGASAQTVLNFLSVQPGFLTYLLLTNPNYLLSFLKGPDGTINLNILTQLYSLVTNLNLRNDINLNIRLQQNSSGEIAVVPNLDGRLSTSIQAIQGLLRNFQRNVGPELICNPPTDEGPIIGSSIAGRIERS